GRLKSELHSGRAETEAVVDLRPEKTVGLRFDRESDAPHAGGLVLRWAVPIESEISPFIASRHPFTNHSWYPRSRDVNVPPSTIKSTLSVGCPMSRRDRRRATTCSPGS